MVLQSSVLFLGPGPRPSELQTSEVDVTIVRYIAYIATIRFFELKESINFTPDFSESPRLIPSTLVHFLRVLTTSLWVAEPRFRTESNTMPVAVCWNRSHLELDNFVISMHDGLGYQSRTFIEVGGEINRLLQLKEPYSSDIDDVTQKRYIDFWGL